LHNELHNAYISPGIVRMMMLGRLGECMGEMRTAYQILVVKPKGKRPLGRPRHRWEDNIKINLEERGCESVD
jgi:hypothetical protein